MTANLLASRFVPTVHFPSYLVLLFGSAMIVSAILWLLHDGRTTLADAQRGALLGAVNIACTFAILTAASAVSGALLFAGMSVTTLLLATLLAGWWWRERLQRRGRIGLGLAAIALLMMNL